MPGTGRIKLLSERLANKIAAGEVVERPASVVKELVENSIDAGATSIRVEVENGGRSLICVTDDGSGMSPDDALLSLERHATSKIKTDDDLFAISTLGFRGEAIPSIASVSRFELLTREHDSDEGTRIKIEGGNLIGVEPAGCAPGTVIYVRNLFYNMPARKKFLRSPDTEFSHIADVVSRMALASPSVRFELIHDGRVVIEAAPSKDRAARIADTLGMTTAERMRPFSMAVDSERFIEGFASTPDHNRSSGNFMFIYVNGRFIRDRLVNHAVMEAYRSFIPKGRYPIVVMFIVMPPDEVDVNVHPTKAEVRFRDSGAMHDLIMKAVLSSFEKAQPGAKPALSQTTSPSDRQPVNIRAPEIQRSLLRAVENIERTESRKDWSATASNDAPPSLAPTPVDHRTLQATSDPLCVNVATTPIEAGYFSSLKVLGRLRDTYIVCQSHEGLTLIDQHAAHERTVFERLKRDYADKRIQRQSLLFPDTIELGHKEAREMTRVMDEIVSLGFDIEPFGPKSFIVRSLPAILGSAEPKAIVMDVLDALSRTHRPGPLQDHLDEVLAKMSCHSVVRAGKALSPEEIAALLKALDNADFPLTCPHGRPIYVRITYGELEKMFGRRN